MAQVVRQTTKQFQETLDFIEAVFSAIRENSGHITSADLDKTFGNKQEVRSAITRLTVSGRISRKRGFGRVGIEYYYHDQSSSSFEKYRRMEVRAYSNAWNELLNSYTFILFYYRFSWLLSWAIMELSYTMYIYRYTVGQEAKKF